MRPSRSIRARAALALCALLALAALFPARPTLATAPGQAETWYKTGTQGEPFCFDEQRPDVVWTKAEGQPGLGAYNWRSGAALGSIPAALHACGPGGWIFSQDAERQAWRANLGTTERIAHFPSARAYDGTLRVYAVAPASEQWPERGGRLWASDDAGAHWAERGQQFNGTVRSVAVAAADSRVVYALVVDRGPDPDAARVSWTIYASSDAGVSWERRLSGMAQWESRSPIAPWFLLQTPASTSAPVETLILTILESNSYGTDYVSSDGGRSWASQDRWNLPDEHISYHHTHQGLLKFFTVGGKYPARGPYRLSLSTDGGQTWSLLPPPSAPPPPGGTKAELAVSLSAPANLVLQDWQGQWHSSDGGHSWRRLPQLAIPTTATFVKIVMTPYLPLTVFHQAAGNPLQALDLSAAGKESTYGVATTRSPHGRFFPETRHNMAPAFVAYWEQHGGLAQFGYPKTEPFYERNAADGKVYLVQYFERNRFEYHPELAGTQYEVLLGLLGNQLTEGRRGGSAWPWARLSGPEIADDIYFPETGHTLRNSFRDYWEANGGLAIYGYPLSQEFHETNPDDGQSYVVQYFERARFEWHPENRGTRYEVLLGLLGTALLREKGWPVNNP